MLWLFELFENWLFHVDNRFFKGIVLLNNIFTSSPWLVWFAPVCRHLHAFCLLFTNILNWRNVMRYSMCDDVSVTNVHILTGRDPQFIISILSVAQSYFGEKTTFFWCAKWATKEIVVSLTTGRETNRLSYKDGNRCNIYTFSLPTIRARY